MPTVMGLISSCLFIGIQAPYPDEYSGVETLVFDKAGQKLEMAENIVRGQKKRDLKIWGERKTGACCSSEDKDAGCSCGSGIYQQRSG